MAASSVRAAVVSREHHHIADFSSAPDEESGSHSRSRTSSKSSTGRRNSSPPRDDSSASKDIDIARDLLNPAYTSTPIADGGGGEGGNGSRRRNRTHSGNSVTFHGATPTRPETLPVAHSSGVMASPGISRTNPDEIIILEGDSSFTSSTSSTVSQTAAAAASHYRRQNSDVQVQAPIVGYEIMEERARFTVFKIHVAKGEEDWFIFRRYTDFVRLNDKLKNIFPHFRLSLPPKKWFGDNFDRNFLEDRMLGLQAFLNNITSHRDVVDSEPVRDFFCYDEPPGAHDSLEESKALCETLEEKVYDLKRALKERDARILLLEEEVALHKAEVENLRKSLRIERALNARHKRSSPTSTSVTSIASQRSDSSLLQDQTSYTEADQAHMSKTSSLAGGEAPEGVNSGCDSVITSPSASSVDLLENLQDLKLHSIRKVENFDSDPNANCEVAPPTVFEPVGNTAELVANVNYAKQESVNTLVNEDLEKSGELEWDEDVSSTHITSTYEHNPDHLDSDGLPKANGATLLPAVQ